MMIVGMPGVGKTPFIASGGRTLIIHPPADNLDSVPAGAPVEEIEVATWADMYEALAYCNSLPPGEFDWVWLDSLSVFQDYGVEDLLKDAITRKPARAIATGETEEIVDESVQSFYVNADQEIMVPEFDADKQEYGINMKRIARWVRDMHGFAKAGKFNFGITTHPVFGWIDPTDEEDKIAPWIQGKGMITKICGYMNLIAYLTEQQRDGAPPQKLLLTKTPGFYGKDQFDCLPQTKSGKRGLPEPTMAEFDKRLAAKRGKSKPTAKRKKVKKARRS